MEIVSLVAPERNKYWMTLTLALFVLGVLQIMDVMTTYWALDHGATEMNPLATFLISHDLLIGVKVISWIGLVGACMLVREYSVKLMRSLWLCVAVYTMVVSSNLIQLIGK